MAMLGILVNDARLMCPIELPGNSPCIHRFSTVFTCCLWCKMKQPSGTGMEAMALERAILQCRVHQSSARMLNGLLC